VTYRGLYLARSLGSTPSRILLPNDGGTSSSPADQARGFIPQSEADGARNEFIQTLGDAPWVPASASEIGPWAKEQAALFTTKQMTQAISDGAKTFAQQLSGDNPVEASLFPPMSEGQVEQWVKEYVGSHGFPTNPSSAMSLARAFVIANSDEIGLPPEFIAASNLIRNFPTTPESAVGWAVSLGSAFLSTYGVPIVDVSDASSFLSASARAAVAQVAPGVPFSLFEATFDALSDGQLTASEAKGIIIGAAGFIGGLVGQAFGLPAPIGALISQLIIGGLVSAISDAFGWGPTDSDKLKAAQDAASAAAAQASAQCTALSGALWLEYQHYWDAIVTDLNKTLRANQQWLTPQGSCSPVSGIRNFVTTSLDVVMKPDGTPVFVPGLSSQGKRVVRRYPYPVTRSCPDGGGCPYMATDIGQLVVRDSYPLSPADLGRMPRVSLEPQGCDGQSALAFWGARRFATPMHVVYAMTGKPNQWIAPSSPSKSELASYNYTPWEGKIHSDAEYLSLLIGNVGTYAFGTQVASCGAAAWASFMFRSLEQAAAAVALVQRDIARTVSGATVAYGIQYHLEQETQVKWQNSSDAQKRAAARAVTAKAAAYRHAIVEAKRKGQRTADMVNYGLLAAGSAAILGWGAAKFR
jgi:hypothetical protein